MVFGHEEWACSWPSQLKFSHLEQTSNYDVRGEILHLHLWAFEPFINFNPFYTDSPSFKQKNLCFTSYVPREPWRDWKTPSWESNPFEVEAIPLSLDLVYIQYYYLVLDVGMLSFLISYFFLQAKRVVSSELCLDSAGSAPTS